MSVSDELESLKDYLQSVRNPEHTSETMLTRMVTAIFRRLIPTDPVTTSNQIFILYPDIAQSPSLPCQESALFIYYP